MKKFSMLFLMLCLLLSFFSIPVSAATTEKNSYQLNNPQDVQRLIDDVKKGNPDAIEKIKSIKAFNKDEVNKVIKGVKFTAAEGPKSFKFDDNSEIVIGVAPGTTDQSAITRSGPYSWSFWYDLKFGEQVMARYTLHMQQFYDTYNGVVWGGTSSDGSWYTYPYTVSCNGTTQLVSSGLFTKARGQGVIDGHGWIGCTVTITGYCYVNPINNWWETQLG